MQRNKVSNKKSSTVISAAFFGQIMSGLFVKKHFKFHRRAAARGSDNFPGYHDGFPGSGELECHGNFLPDGQLPGGFDKYSGATYVLDRRIELGVRGFAADDDGLVFLE